jgi:hypothetical protein
MASKPDTKPQAVGTNHISKTTWTNYEKSLGQYFQIQLFITSLQDQIRKELMKYLCQLPGRQ